jgi:hypothetical protein
MGRGLTTNNGSNELSIVQKAGNEAGVGHDNAIAPSSSYKMKGLACWNLEQQAIAGRVWAMAGAMTGASQILPGQSHEDQNKIIKP